ncbi:phosphate/phosphite/phosphonate ABC transporter substrate-binding protein [Halobacteriales archaeon QH_10_67_13]|nr:MAG: phosphate/phosphite/phosphonate ABC transporter substrate-binding protein [Halobacteriales archaeon QH_10_67_13]
MSERHEEGAGVSYEWTTRRRFVTAAGAAGVAGLAGCTGDDDGDDTAGSEEDFPEWDSEDPAFPQLASTLLEDEFHVGSPALLESMEQRDEPRYGNPVPETPSPGDQLDPDTIEFSVVPTEDPDAYGDIWAPLVENMEAETGRSVTVNPLDSSAAQIEAMRADRLHVTGFSTGTVPFAVNIAGARPFAMQVSEGQFGYKLWVLTQADSSISSLGDIAGADIAHVEETSNSGHQAPVALFSSEGVAPGEDYEFEFSGSHENSIRGVAAGDYEAAPIASTVLFRQADSGEVDPDELKVVYSSDPFPTTGFSVNPRLTPELQEGIVASHLEYDYAGTSIEEFYERGQFIEIDYATNWDVILQIQEQNEVDYQVDQI